MLCLIVFQISDILLATLLILLSKANLLSCKSSNSKSIVTTLDARWHSTPLLLEARLVEIIIVIVKGYHHSIGCCFFFFFVLLEVKLIILLVLGSALADSMNVFY